MEVCLLHRSLLIIKRHKQNCGSQNPYSAVKNTTLGILFLAAKTYSSISELIVEKAVSQKLGITRSLRDEHGFKGGYTTVKNYVREHGRLNREMFVPLAHAPGHAQADFGEAMVVIGGVEQKAHFFALDLPHSDACFVRAYPAAVSEAWIDGHVHAFAFFGRVPQSVLYDNDRCLVAKILSDGIRKRTKLFSGFLSHYFIHDRYGRPGKGNDKGAVEGLVGYARRNFMVPIPRFATWDALNLWLAVPSRMIT